MLVGLIIATQLIWPALNFDIPWLSYGRLRPLHTNAVIFAFGGCALFATSLHVVQRTCHVRLLSAGLADRKSVVSGKSGSVRVDLGGRRIIKKKGNKENNDAIIPTKVTTTATVPLRQRHRHKIQKMLAI